MILAINIGNTNTAVGFWEQGAMRQVRFPTVRLDGSGRFLRFLEDELDRGGVLPDAIHSSIAASVVPDKTWVVAEAVAALTGNSPLVLNRPSDFGIDLSAYDTRLLGSDRILCCLAAFEKFAAPLVVFDLGTATTANVVDKNGAFLGGAILPGVRMGLEALARNTSLLPDARLGDRVPPIGRSTGQCLESGAVYGAVFAMEGYAARFREDMGQPLTVVVTGGNAESVLPYCDMQAYYEPTLLLDGLVSLCKRRLATNLRLK